LSKKNELSKLLAELEPTIEELPGDLSQLARIIEMFAPGHGVKATMKIATEFQSTYIYCHAIDDLKRAARDRWIREQYDKGARVPDLARAVPMSERQVWRVLNKAPVDDRQMRMF
jgi:Mor family transcriptional regulator